MEFRSSDDHTARISAVLFRVPYIAYRIVWHLTGSAARRRANVIRTETALDPFGVRYYTGLSGDSRSRRATESRSRSVLVYLPRSVHLDIETPVFRAVQHGFPDSTKPANLIHGLPPAVGGKASGTARRTNPATDISEVLAARFASRYSCSSRLSWCGSCCYRVDLS
jgi:hypothetical protein